MTQRQAPRQDKVTELGIKLIQAHDTLNLIRDVISDPDAYRVPAWALARIDQILGEEKKEVE